jgi:hypothetical protein
LLAGMPDEWVCAFAWAVSIHHITEETMVKTSLAAALTLMLGLSGAYAAQDLCNNAHMKQMDGMIAEMTDKAKQKEAMAALDKSKSAMKAGNKAECMKYMDEAHKAMGL